MMIFVRPAKPAGFDQATAKAREKISVLVARGEKVRSEDFLNEWSDFKPFFAEAQHDRCGFCDRKVMADGHGDIEHFRPKAAVDQWIGQGTSPADWGTTRPHVAEVKERPIRRGVSSAGYHWLAYDWDNYLLSCRLCNHHKQNLFPVADLPRTLPPDPGVAEVPLLLSCYGPLRPSEHLQYNDDGTIEPYEGSRHGLETIRTCALHRLPLCDVRREITPRAHALMKTLGESLPGSAEEREVLKDLAGLGMEEREYAGIVRTIAEQKAGMRWEELMLYAGLPHTFPVQAPSVATGPAPEPTVVPVSEG